MFCTLLVLSRVRLSVSHPGKVSCTKPPNSTGLVFLHPDPLTSLNVSHNHQADEICPFPSSSPSTHVLRQETTSHATDSPKPNAKSSRTKNVLHQRQPAPPTAIPAEYVNQTAKTAFSETTPCCVLLSLTVRIIRTDRPYLGAALDEHLRRPLNEEPVVRLVPSRAAQHRHRFAVAAANRVQASSSSSRDEDDSKLKDTENVSGFRSH